MTHAAETLINQAIEIFHDFVRREGGRVTPQRDLILREFFSSGDHLSAEDLFMRTKQKDESVNLATVYRTLKLLVASELATELAMPHGSSLYESNFKRDHHEHLICISCGKIVEFIEPVIEKAQDQIAKKHGFKMISHKHEIRGLCKDCQKK
jgi:Fur family ferric uptake transcriptional regulator